MLKPNRNSANCARGISGVFILYAGDIYEQH